MTFPSGVSSTSNTFEVAAWPSDKIERNLALPARGRRAVLLTTGALNPVHRGHVAMFDKAKDALVSEHNLEVVGGFLSPSNDLYLLDKYGHSSMFYSAEKRLQMCLAATKDHPFLSVGSWKSFVPDRWPDFPEVTENLVQTLGSQFPEDNLLVLYLCGEDHFKYAINANLPGICVVSRGGRGSTTNTKRNIFAVTGNASDPYSETSATSIRRALEINDLTTLQSDLHPDVLAILRAP